MMVDLQSISSDLTEGFLSQQLSKWFDKNVLYTKHEVSELSGKGDSYLSEIYRMRFHGTIVSSESDSNVFINVILKCIPKNIGRRKTFRCADFFQTEICFYTEVLPVLMKFQSEKNISDPFLNCPKLFGANTDGINDFLALEDLHFTGYRSAVRQETINYSHCKKILKIFAKFHAMSFAFKDQHPQRYKKLSDSLPESSFDLKFWDWFRGFWNLVCISAIDAVESEYPNTVYSRKIKNFATEATFKKMISTTNPDIKSAVISHGDSWTPNFLFRYDDDESAPKDIMFIDFQMARSASPVIDLSFFIYGCSSEELRNNYYEDMLVYYYKVLSKQIQAMGSNSDEVYSWNTFIDEIKKLSYFGVALSMESTPLIVLEAEEAFDVNSIKGEDAIRLEDIMKIKPIKTKQGRKRMASVIKHAVDYDYI